MELDDLDFGILAILQRDSRTPVAEIGLAVGLTKTPTLNRIRRMERVGVITGYTVQVDARKLGIAITALTAVTLKSNQLHEVENFLSEITQMPQVLKCWGVTGEHDFLLRCEFESLQDFERFCNEKLAATSNIGRSTSMILMKSYKDSRMAPGFKATLRRKPGTRTVKTAELKTPRGTGRKGPKPV